MSTPDVMFKVGFVELLEPIHLYSLFTSLAVSSIDVFDPSSYAYIFSKFVSVFANNMKTVATIIIRVVILFCNLLLLFSNIVLS